MNRSKLSLTRPTLLLIFFLTLLAAPSAALAGAWCLQQGSLYSKLSYSQYFTVDTYDKHGDKHRNPDGSNFHDQNVTWYAEYGLLDHLTTFVSLPYKQLRSHYRLREDDEVKHTTSSYNGPGDLELGLKLCLFEKPVVLSAQVLTKVAWLYDGHEKVPPGNNQNDYEIKVLVGRSLWPFPGYCGAELGYRWRTNDPSDEYRYLLEVGVNFTKKLSGRVKLDGIKSVQNARLPATPAPRTDAYVDYETGRVVKTTYDPAHSTAGFANPSLGIEYDLAKLELTLGYQVTRRWSIEGTYTGYPYGENIAAGDQYSLALVYFFTR